MKINFFLLASLLVCVLLLSSVSAWDPRDNITLRDRYSIEGGVNANFTLYYGNGSQLTNINSVTSNYSSFANSSDYWDDMNTINTTQMENNGGTLNILVSWFTTQWNAIFATKDTDDLTEGSTNLYDNQSWNETRGDNIYVNIDGDTMTGNLSLGNNNIVEVAKILFNLTVCGDGEVAGTLCHDVEHDTLKYYTVGGQTIQISQEVTTPMKNKESSMVMDGSYVYQSGASGDNLEFKLAKADNFNTSGLVGVLTRPCNADEICPVTFFGFVNDIDTSSFSLNDKRYLSSTEAGNTTTTAPEFPNNIVWIDTVVRVNANNGRVFVAPRLDTANGMTFNTIGVIGDIIQTDYKIRSLVGHASISQNVFVIEMNGTTGQEIPHLVLQPGGAEQASIGVRSWIFAPEAPNCLNNTNRTDSSCYATEGGFVWQIADFNTSISEGADVAVTGELEVVKSAYVHINLTVNDSLIVTNNITASWFSGFVDWSDIQNKFITAVDDIYIYMSGTIATLNETKLNETIELIDTATNTSMKNYVDGTFITQSNEANLNVNSSDYWDDMGTINSTQLENSAGELNIKESWLTTFWNAIFATKDTDDLTEGSTNLYDNQSWNETHADTLYADISIDGTVTSVATDDTYLTGGPITSTGTITFSTALAGTDLAVNSSDYWDNLNTPTDITSLGTIGSATSITSSAFVGPLTGTADIATSWDGETSQANLNVNSSDFWDGLNTPSDISTGDLTNDGTYYLNSNPFTYWNDTYATFNKTYADSLYLTGQLSLFFYNNTDSFNSSYTVMNTTINTDLQVDTFSGLSDGDNLLAKRILSTLDLSILETGAYNQHTTIDYISGSKDVQLRSTIHVLLANGTEIQIGSSPISPVLSTGTYQQVIWTGIIDTEYTLSTGDYLTMYLYAFVSGGGAAPTVDLVVGGSTSARLDIGINPNDISTTEVDPFWTGNQSSYVPYTGSDTNLDLGSNNFSVDTSTLFVDSDNNRVGIGTDSPSAPLEVSEKMNIYNDASHGELIVGNNNDVTADNLGGYLYLGKFGAPQGSGSSVGAIYFESKTTDSITHVAGVQSNIVLGNTTRSLTTGNLDFTTKGSGMDDPRSRLRMDENGNIGFGGTITDFDFTGAYMTLNNGDLNLTTGSYYGDGSQLTGIGGSGTVTNVATDDTFLTGGPITSAGTITFNTTLAGTSLSVNSADNWDNLNTPTDITSLGTIGSATSITSSAFVGPLTGTADIATSWDGETSQANLNVNSSDFWDALDTVADILGSLINNDFSWINQTQADLLYAPISILGTVTSITAGNGMDFTTITSTGSVTMGTPGSLTAGTSNAVTSTSHTHAVSGFLESLADDSSPQLGGYLDANGQNIGSTTDEIENIYVGDTTRIYFGDGQDASIHFNGTNLIISG